MHSSSPICPPLLALLDDHEDDSTINFLLSEKDRLRRYGYRKLCIEIPDHMTLDEYFIYLENILAFNKSIIQLFNLHICRLPGVENIEKEYFSRCNTDSGIERLYEERAQTMKILNDLHAKNSIDIKTVHIFLKYFRLRSQLHFLQSIRSTFDVIFIDMNIDLSRPNAIAIRDVYMTRKIKPLIEAKIGTIVFTGFVHISVINYLQASIDTLNFLAYAFTCSEVFSQIDPVTHDTYKLAREQMHRNREEKLQNPPPLWKDVDVTRSNQREVFTQIAEQIGRKTMAPLIDRGFFKLPAMPKNPSPLISDGHVHDQTFYCDASNRLLGKS